MFLPIILIGSIVTLIFIYLVGNNNERYWNKRGVKFHKKNKVTGVFWDFFMKEGALFEGFGDLYKEYKNEPAVGIGAFLTPALFVTNPKNLQHVLQTDFNSFYHRGIDVNEGDQLADNILFMNGPRWKLMRQSMTPLFTSSKLKSMYYIMDKSAQDFVAYLKNNPKTWDNECFETLMTFCNAAVCGAIFGIGTESVFDSPFLKTAKRITAPTLINNLRTAIMSFSPRVAKFLRIKLFKEYEDFLIGAVTKVIQERKKENVKRHDFADICINIQKNGVMKDPMTGCELEPSYGILSAQAMFFLIAGVEPVAIVIFTALVHLGRNPDILAKVQQEIDESFEKYENNMTYDVISEMNYVDKVLSEAMRINPPIGFLTRKCVKETVLPVGNIKVDKGTNMFMPLYHLHNDPDLYPEPHVFDPERFAKDNKQSEEFYMPFGMGGRMCIGARYSKLQMAAGLVHILRHFTVKTKELGGPKFRYHFTTVRRIDVDIALVPRNLK